MVGSRFPRGQRVPDYKNKKRSDGIETEKTIAAVTDGVNSNSRQRHGFGAETKTFTVFLSEPLPDYPGSTIVGDIIEKETGVKLQREYLVGDLETKVGLMIASGELPDMLTAAHFTSLFKDAGMLIPLNDLVEKHAPNIKRLYAKHWEQLKQEDGNVYWLPIQAIPYDTDDSRYPELGFFINKKVFEGSRMAED